MADWRDVRLNRRVRFAHPLVQVLLENEPVERPPLTVEQITAQVFEDYQEDGDILLMRMEAVFREQYSLRYLDFIIFLMPYLPIIMTAIIRMIKYFALRFMW